MSKTNSIAYKVARHFAYLVTLLCLCTDIRAQQYPMLHFTKEDGLPSNTVYEVYRDSRGFLWMGTDKGAARYNGINFQTFTIADGLSDNEVFLFQEDKFHRIWLGTYNGELCFYKDGMFHNAKNTPWLKLPFKTPLVNDLQIEFDSSLTVQYSDIFIMLNIIDSSPDIHYFKRNQYQHFKKGISLRKVDPFQYEIAQQFEISTVDTSGNMLDVRRIYNGPYIALTTVQNQHYLYGKNSFYKYDGSIAGNFPDGFFDAHVIHNIYLDSNGNKFVSTATGLYINDSIEMLPNINIASVNQDLSGNYWISTLTDGIYCLKKNFLSTFTATGSYSGKAVFAHAQNGKFIFSTHEGNIYGLNAHNIIKRVDYAAFNNTKVKRESGIFVFGADYYDVFVNCILKAEHLFSDSAITVRTYPIYAIAKIVKNAMIVDKKLYFCDNRFIFYFDSSSLNEKRTSNAHLLSEYDSSSFRPEQTDRTRKIFSSACAPDGTLWFSSLLDIFTLRGTETQEQKQFGNTTFKNFIFHGRFLIGCDHHNNLLVCTNYNERPVIKAIPDQNCIWDKIYPLDDLHALLSSNTLYYVLQLGDSPVVYPVETPFIPRDCDIFYCDGSNCLFLKQGQVISIDKSSVLQKETPPLLYFSSFKTGNSSCFIKDQISVSYNSSRSLSFSFIPVTGNSKYITYAYSISSNDKENWKTVAQNEVNLANPEFGIYKISVKAKTLSSDYCPPIAFTLIIERPWWATWWFRSAIAAILLGMVVLITRYRIRANDRKNEMQHQQEVRFLKSEYKALNALMNPHFIFNTLNNMQSLVNKDEKRAANEYLRIFANLIRQNMHNISLEMISLQDEMDLVANYLRLEKLRFKDFLNYQINVEDQVDMTEIMVPPLLIQPLVENSIKHGLFPKKSADNQLIIDIREAENVLVIQVKDNGLGFSEAQKRNDPQHKSFGMENLRKRIAQASMIQGRQMSLDLSEKTDAAGNHTWTVVTITINLADGTQN